LLAVAKNHRLRVFQESGADFGEHMGYERFRFATSNIRKSPANRSPSYTGPKFCTAFLENNAAGDFLATAANPVSDL